MRVAKLILVVEPGTGRTSKLVPIQQSSPLSIDPPRIKPRMASIYFLGSKRRPGLEGIARRVKEKVKSERVRQTLTCLGTIELRRLNSSD
jgi:hypothetical protein